MSSTRLPSSEVIRLLALYEADLQRAIELCEGAYQRACRGEPIMPDVAQRIIEGLDRWEAERLPALTLIKGGR